MDQLLTEEPIADVKRTEASTGTWSRVVRLIEAHPDVKQVRLNTNEYSVSIGFYERPSPEILDRLETDVRAALSGQWNVSVISDDKSSTIHLHKLDNYRTEFHRTHPRRRTANNLEIDCAAGVAKPPVSAPCAARSPCHVVFGGDLWIKYPCRFSPRSRRHPRRSGGAFLCSRLCERRLVRHSGCLACAQARQDRHSVPDGGRRARRAIC